jgi:V/A-type H+-transporting ATPase subunit D
MFMGVTLLETQLLIVPNRDTTNAANPSPEANHCQKVFQELVKISGIIAGVSGNLHRLLAEYRRTERRARALENVVIPEIQQTLQAMATQLEELDQEDVIRVHLHCAKD